MSTSIERWVASCRSFSNELNKQSFWQKSQYCEWILTEQASSIQKENKFLSAYEVFTDLVRIEQQKSQFKEHAVICIIGTGVGFGFGLISGAKKVAAVAVIALLCFYAHRLYTNAWGFLKVPPNQLLEQKLREFDKPAEITLPKTLSGREPTVEEVD